MAKEAKILQKTEVPINEKENVGCAAFELAPEEVQMILKELGRLRSVKKLSDDEDDEDFFAIEEFLTMEKIFGNLMKMSLPSFAACNRREKKDNDVVRRRESRTPNGKRAGNRRRREK